jgi:putative ABC transport system permease protein
MERQGKLDRRLPTRLQRLLVRLLAPADERSAILDDLEEEAAEVAAANGAAAARRFIRWQLAHSATPWIARRARESTARLWRTRLMLHSGLASDIRLATRRLLADRAFTTLAAVTLAIGIGAISTVFSLAHALWLKPVPYQDPDQLVWIHALHAPSGTTRSMTVAEFDAQRRDSQTLSAVAGFVYGARIAKVNNVPLRIVAHAVTPNLFRVLGVNPVMGRDFTDGDAAEGGRVVMLSYATWTRRFGQDPHVLQRTLTLDGEVYAIAGVMPKGFTFPRGPLEADVWVPGTLHRGLAATDRVIEGVARLNDGRSIEDAAAEAKSRASALAHDAPPAQREWTTHVRSAAVTASDSSRLAFQALLGMVFLFLVVACTNLAGLLLARNAGRRSEIALCLSLGASRWRLARGLLIESLLLAAAGCAAGILLSSYAARALSALMPSRMPGLDEVALNMTVVAVAAGVSLLAAVFIGLLPSLSLGAMKPAEALAGTRTYSRGMARSQRALVVAEIVLAVVLLVGAASMARSLAGVLTRDRGYEPRGLHTLNVSLPFSDDSFLDTSRRARAFGEMMARVAAVPGISSVGATTGFPGSRLGVLGSAPVMPVGGQAPVMAAIHAASAGYFDTMGTRLTAGRRFTDADSTTGPRVAIVSESLAKQFPGSNPIGRLIPISVMGQDANYEIVGVAGDIKLTERAGYRIFLPITQAPTFWVDLVFRAGGTEAPMREVQATLRAISAEYLIENESSFQSIIAESVALERTQSAFAVTIGILSTIVAGVGLYALMTFIAVQRRREFGIRLALGSQRGRLLVAALSSSLRLVAVGLVLGTLTAAAFVRALGSRVFGLSTADASAYATAMAVVLAVSCMAIWIPARRVARVDPLIALKADT